MSLFGPCGFVSFISQEVWLYMAPSRFLEEVNPIPPFSKVAFMFSILYLLLIDIWKKILALFQISCKNIFRCSRRDCNSLKGTRRLPLRKNSSGIFLHWCLYGRKMEKCQVFLIFVIYLNQLLICLHNQSDGGYP